MDDARLDHFLTVIGDLCEAARVGELEVEAQTVTGDSFRGIPAPRATHGTDEVDDTGWANPVRIDDQTVEVLDITSIAIRRPVT